MDNVPGYEIPLPELRQIRNYKRNTNTPHNNEYEEVLRKINELSSNLDDLDDRQAFTYGVKMGIGSDNDPFIVCFTSKYIKYDVTIQPLQFYIHFTRRVLCRSKCGE